MTDIKQAIELLERMTAEPAPGEDARLDADELDAVLFAIKELKAPAIKPKRMTIDKDTVVFDYIPRGEWIIDGHHRRCNYCNEYTCTEDREGNSIPDNFCPNCGALMEKEAST